jgi:low temperature requirement protein LtrA
MTAGTDAEARSGYPQQPAYIELLFDVVYVFALTRISAVLYEDLSWVGALKTLILLSAFWWIWLYTSWTTNQIYTIWTASHRGTVQLSLHTVVIPTMLGAMLMAGAAREAFGDEGLIFAVTYAGSQLARTAFVGVILRKQRHMALGSQQIFLWLSLASVFWIVGALNEGASRLVLWTVAMLLGYVMSGVDFDVPGLGPAYVSTSKINPGHLSERYRQFILIAFGETILASGFQFSDYDYELERTLAFLVVVTGTVLMWRIYYYRAGELLPAAIVNTRAPAAFSKVASYAHLVMVAGIIGMAVGDEVVIAHPLDRPELAWVVVILGGPALFLIGRAWLDFLTFGRVSWSRVVGLLALGTVAPAAVMLPPILVSVTLAVILTGIVATDTYAWRIRPRQPLPPIP